MQTQDTPQFPPAWQALVSQAAEALRTLALDESAKQRFCRDPACKPFMQRVAARYVAGSTIADVLKRVRSIHARGHGASAEYMGESCRDAAFAASETGVFLALIDALDAAQLPCSISLDLSHIGSVIDPDLGFANARRIAAAAAKAGRELMISMEGADRADNIYATYARLHTDAGLSNVGITVPAKLHRTARDLPALLQYPGRIRLVKGAFAEPAELALGRDDPQLGAVYRDYATQLIAAGHLCSIATHDRGIQRDVTDIMTRRDPPCAHVEFESLMGLGTDRIDDLQKRGYYTREYAVFGEEYFLYVLNRIAEEPVRLYQAVVDLMAPGDAGTGPA